MAITAVHHANASRGSRKLWLLWLLLVVQLFIFCFWMLQTTYQDQYHAVGEMHIRKTSYENNKPNEFKGVPAYNNDNRIKTARKNNSAFNMNTARKGNSERTAFVAKAKITKKYNSSISLKINAWENVNNFKRDYFKVNINNQLINTTGMEAEMFEIEWEKYIKCFREGTTTLNDTKSLLFWNVDAQSAQCKCEKYWHGKDCGQPEVIWRALMLPGKQFKIREINENMRPHRLIYMLEGYFNSLDFLELQIKSLENIVDQFLIYLITSNTNERVAIMLNLLQRRLNEILNPQRYILYYCIKTKMDICSTVKAFKYFRKQLKLKLDNQLMASDLFLYSNENIIYAREPLKFLKYYSTAEMPVWRFRLKHNVYGFYWLHPERTHLSGSICSFGYLESAENQQNLLKTIDTSTEYSSSVIGDLNHYGGWFCQYCQHPDEILKDLHELPNDSSSYMKFEFPNGTRNRLIDSKHLEYLIAKGIHIDGKTQLLKIRQYNDKYFSPAYAESCKWKFGNILTNLFEAMESDYIIEEAEGGAGF